MGALTQLDLLLLMGYAIFIFALGASRYRKSANAREFFLAGRAAGPVAVGVSLMVSLASSLGYVAVPTAANRSGIIMLWSLLALPLCYPYITRVIIPFYQKLDVTTPYEYLEKRFGRASRLVASGLFIAWRVTWMGAVLYVPAMALNVATQGQVPVVAGVFALGVLATSYTMLGGLHGVLRADKAQFVVMFGGIGVALYAICTQVPDGFSGIMQRAAETGKLSWTAASAGWDGTSWPGMLRSYLYTDFTAPAIVLCFTIGKLANYSVDQLLVQRLLSAKSVGTARRGFLLHCIVFAVFFTLMTFTGLAVSAYAGIREFPKLKPDEIFPYYMANYAPSGLAGLMIAGLVAAAVSSIDSGINACSSAVCNDFYRHAATSDVNDVRFVRIGRAVTVAVGVAAILVGSFVGRLGDVFEIALKVVNSFAAPLLAMFLLAMFCRRATQRGVIFGVLMGCAFTALLIFARPLASVFPYARVLNIGFLWVVPFGFVLTFVSGYAASLLLPVADARNTKWSYRAVVGALPPPTPLRKAEVA
ncbi:MAG: sodium/solute symporter [Candidatus Hydrogenedentes bacterium]|nr:sodium/solute symporter [Candidatus Hydrogenedentota bacterium]